MPALSIDPRLLAYVFGVVFIAELPDKTALAALVLATRHRPLPVFLGAAAALTVQSVVAILAGELVSLLPARAVHIGAGVLFLGSAWFMWRRPAEARDADRGDKKDEGDTRARFWRAAWLVFGVVFVAEWGDLTQLATAAMAARYRAPFTVFVGATLALWAVTAIAVFVGNRAGKLLDPALTKRIAAAVFAAVGVALIAGVL
jgi:putative Ca2+/H+ antiporter (TMEM165/GDT1 family)